MCKGQSLVVFWNIFCEYADVHSDCCMHLFCITYFRVLNLVGFSSSCRKRRPRETAVAAMVENVRTQRRKQTGRPLSVFLCEVIMCSPRCFCSHANEVDRVGNHFKTLSQGKSRNSKTKA